MDRPIVLVFCPVLIELSEYARPQAESPPLGLLSIATVLRGQGYEVYVRDLTAENISKDEFMKWLESMNPRVLGMSVIAENCESVKVLALSAKKLISDIKTVFGGPLPTFMYEELIKETQVDYIIRGEGEYTMLELCNWIYGNDPKKTHVGPEGIQGLVFKAEEEIVTTPPRDLIPDLDKLPIPDRSFVNLEHYQFPFTLIGSRGCMGKCTFCSSRHFWQEKVRYNSVARVIEELDYLRSLDGFECLWITDDTFYVSPSRMEAFCGTLIDRGINITWRCSSRIDTCNVKLLDLMAEAGCSGLLLGIESGDNRVLKSIGKNIQIDQVNEKVKQARMAGLDLLCSFIIAHPDDTLETLQKTVSFAEHIIKDYGGNVLYCYNTPYPGTYQYNHAIELGLCIEMRNWNDYVTEWILKRTRYLNREVMSELWKGRLLGRKIGTPHYRFLVPEILVKL